MKILKEKLTNKLTAGALTVFAVSASLSQDVFAKTAQDALREGANTTGQTGGVTVDNAIETVVNTLLFIVGLIAVIMIIFSGIKYVTSNGDASNVKSAKDTLLYSVVGLIVAIIAYALVNWVIGLF